MSAYQDGYEDGFYGRSGSCSYLPGSDEWRLYHDAYMDGAYDAAFESAECEHGVSLDNDCPDCAL